MSQPPLSFRIGQIPTHYLGGKTGYVGRIDTMGKTKTNKTINLPGNASEDRKTLKQNKNKITTSINLDHCFLSSWVIASFLLHASFSNSAQNRSFRADAKSISCSSRRPASQSFVCLFVFNYYSPVASFLDVSLSE